MALLAKLKKVDKTIKIAWKFMVFTKISLKIISKFGFQKKCFRLAARRVRYQYPRFRMKPLEVWPRSKQLRIVLRRVS